LAAECKLVEIRSAQRQPLADIDAEIVSIQITWEALYVYFVQRGNTLSDALPVYAH
jgi:hypothetical protein